MKTKNKNDIVMNIPRIVISKNIFLDINTWLIEHDINTDNIIEILISPRIYKVETSNRVINIPLEEIKEIAEKKNKIYQDYIISKYNNNGKE